MPVTSRIAAAAARGFGLFSAIAKVTDAYFKYVTLLLPGNGTNGAQNNTFLDSSTNAFTITRNGNTTQGNFSPFSQTGWGNYFNGSTDYLSGIGSVSSFNFMHNTTALFTAECWVYINSLASIMTLFDNNNSTTAQTGVTAQIYTNGTINLLITYGSTGNNIANVTTTGTVTTNQWTHIAFVYDQSVASNNAQIYINGTLAGSGNKTANTPSSGNASNALRIGCYGAGTGQFMNGYISNFRISNSKVYTANFTPSTTALTTSSQGATSVALLTCQSNRFVDNSSNAFAITANGTPSVQAFSPFAPTAAWSATTNGGSGYFDGSGDYLALPDNAAFDIGLSSNPFTIECWYYPTATSDAYLFARGGGTGAWNGTTGWQYILFTYNSSSSIYFQYWSGSALVNMSGAWPSSYGLNRWNHIAVSYDGTNTAIFVNGTRIATSTTGYGKPSSSNLINISRSVVAGETGYATGYITDARVVKGTAVYNPTLTTYTVPTAPLTAITNTVFLANCTNGGIVDATAKNDLETVGNAQISTTQSKFGGSSMKFDGTGDWLYGVVNDDRFGFGTGDFTIEFWAWKSANGVSGYDGVMTIASGASTKWFVELSATRGFLFYNKTSAQFCQNTTTTGINDSTWHHWAICRSGSTWYLFKDGTALTKNTDAIGASSISNGTNIYVGAEYDSTAYEFNGYINGLRITKGVARYTANFTPPTTAFPVQ